MRLLPRAGASADVPVPYDWRAMPPTDSTDAFIAWMVANRGEDPLYLGQRFGRYQHMVGHNDLFTDRDKRAFLMTPREEFCLRPTCRASMTAPSSTSASASPSPAPTSSAA